MGLQKLQGVMPRCLCCRQPCITPAPTPTLASLSLPPHCMHSCALPPLHYLCCTADECNITATELNRNMRVMYRFLSEATGLPEEQVEMECGEWGWSGSGVVELGGRWLGQGQRQRGLGGVGWWLRMRCTSPPAAGMTGWRILLHHLLHPLTHTWPLPALPQTVTTS
jgi:hypothetical protein